MDELDKKAQKGLDEFRKSDSFEGVKSSLDNMVDGLFDEPDGVVVNEDQSPKNSKGFRFAAITFILLALAYIAYSGYQEGSKAKSPQQVQKAEPKVLFAQYFEPMEDLTSDVSRGDAVDETEDVNNGMQLYGQKQYREAASILLASEEPEQQFYGALSLLNSGNAKEALLLLERMQKSELYNQYQDIVSWYIALAYLSEENDAEAKKELNSIIAIKGYKAKEAKIILESM